MTREELEKILKNNPKAKMLRGGSGQSAHVQLATETHNDIARAYNLVRGQLSNDLPEEMLDALTRSFLALANALRVPLP